MSENDYRYRQLNPTEQNESNTREHEEMLRVRQEAQGAIPMDSAAGDNP